MANTLALLVLVSWPFVLIHLFKKLEPASAVIWGTVLSYLFLPLGAEIDLKVIPEINKYTLPYIVMLILCIKKVDGFKLTVEDTLARRLLIVYLISPIFTVMSNSDQLVYGNVILPALTIKDALKPTFTNIFAYVAPLIIGRNLFKTPESHKLLLKVVIFGCAIYSVPILWEIRMSPQLHAKIYGFMPHEFAQHIRFGGFRPMVFLGHGLLISFFVAVGVAGAACLLKMQDEPMNKFGKAKMALIMGLLVVCKSVGATLYGISMVLLIFFSSKKMMLRVAAVFAVIVLCFPILRAEGIFPAKELTGFAEKYDADRAQSLQFRFDNEDRLLDKASLRPILGWGGWGRNLIYNKWTDKSDVITDGTWIIVLSMWGYFGFISFFGLLCYIPLKLYLSNKSKKNKKEITLYTATLGLIFGFNLVELLPNSSISAITMLIAGALLGYMEAPQKGETEDGSEKHKSTTLGAKK